MFFFWPIGHDNTTLKRAPHVTIAILALNVIVFIFTYALHGSTAGRSQERAERALRYAIEHPHTRLHPDFTTKLINDGNQRSLLEGQLNSLRTAAPSPSPEDLSAQQRKLDDLCRLALTGLDKLADRYEMQLGFVPARPSVTSILTSMFTHGGWEHLLGNLFLLYLAAPFLEAAFGGPVFALVYLVGGAAASLLHMKMNAGSEVPLIGASGAIFAVTGAFLVRFYAARIRFWYFVWVIKFFNGTFWAPAYVVLPLLLAREYLHASSAAVSGVAHWAHVGGFTFGFAAAVVVKAMRLEETAITPPDGIVLRQKQSPSLHKGVIGRLDGNHDGSLTHLQRAVRETPNDPDVHIELFRTQIERGYLAAAAQHAARHLELALKSQDLEAVADAYDEIFGRLPEIALPPAVLLAVGRQAERVGEVTRAVVLYERISRQHPRDPLTARALAAAAEIDVARGEPAAALLTLRRALMVPLDPAVADHLVARLREIAEQHRLPVPRIERAAPIGVPPPIQR